MHSLNELFTYVVDIPYIYSGYQFFSSLKVTSPLANHYYYLHLLFISTQLSVILKTNAINKMMTDENNEI